jgi:hypothetical protein
MAITYKAFFRYDDYFWIPIHAFYIRADGIPNFILISSPGLNADIFRALVEVRDARSLTLAVSDLTRKSIIGGKAIDGLGPRYYSDKSKTISMAFAVEKYSGGKQVEKIWLQDRNADVGFGPSRHVDRYFWGWEFRLTLNSAILSGDLPAPGT